jgi:hypothetical protein
VVSREGWFFLPGRFTIAEAFDPAISGTPASAADFLAAVLPRYAGTLGLFGYQQNPSLTQFPMVALGKVLDHPQAGYIFPSRRITAEAAPGSTVIETLGGSGYRGNLAGLTIPLLPVIYNPYGLGMREPAETLSVPVLYLEEGAETIPDDGFTHVFAKVLCHPEVPANTFVVAPGADGIPDFPPCGSPYGPRIDASQGFMLECIGHHRPQMYRRFRDGTAAYVMTRNPARVQEIDRVRHRKLANFVSNYFHVNMLASAGLRPQVHQVWHVVFPVTRSDGTQIRRAVDVWSPVTAMVTVFRFRFDGRDWKLVLEGAADKETLEKNLLVR